MGLEEGDTEGGGITLRVFMRGGLEGEMWKGGGKERTAAPPGCSTNSFAPGGSWDTHSAMILLKIRKRENLNQHGFSRERGELLGFRLLVKLNGGAHLGWPGTLDAVNGKAEVLNTDSRGLSNSTNASHLVPLTQLFHAIPPCQ